MRETWYVLENGCVADPREVAPDEAGVLRHSSGVAVAYVNGVTRSRGVDPDEERAKAQQEAARDKQWQADPEAQRADKELKPDAPPPPPPKRGYKTRESKAG